MTILLLAPLLARAAPTADGPDALVCQQGERREACCAEAPTRCFATLAEAVGQAVDGETIEIGAGVYAGVAQIGASVTISGRRGDLPPVLVLDQGGDKNLISVYGGASVTLRNVTLSSALGRAMEVNEGCSLLVEDSFVASGAVITFGGAARVHPGGALTLRRVVIEGGTASSRGGQVYGELADVTIDSCTLAGGVAQDAGGAVAIEGPGSLVLVDSAVTGATSYGDGGALHIRGSVAVSITRSAVTDNRAAGAGGALALRGGDATIEDSTMTDNEAEGNGGAIVSGDGVALTLRRTTFARNRSLAGNGGAIGWAGGLAPAEAAWSNLWFVENRSLGLGGAVWLDALGSLDLVRSGFVGNESGARGAAVALRRLERADLLDLLVAYSRGGGAVDYGGVPARCAGVWFDNQGGHAVSADGGACLAGPDNQRDVDPRLYAYSGDANPLNDDFGYHPATSPLVGRSVLGGVDPDGSPADVGPAGGPEAASASWLDEDGDGWPAVYDCNEALGSVHPGVRADVADGQDDNCDGSDLVDLDRDGWTPPQDCDDLDPAVHPGAPEDADLALDRDCDGFTAPTTALVPAGCTTGAGGRSGPWWGAVAWCFVLRCVGERRAVGVCPRRG